MARFIMQLMQAILTSKGQVTIPKVIRDFLKIESGDHIDFVISNQGEVLISPRTHDFRQLKGFFYDKKRKKASLEDMENAIRKGASRSLS